MCENLISLCMNSKIFLNILLDKYNRHFHLPQPVINICTSPVSFIFSDNMLQILNYMPVFNFSIIFRWGADSVGGSEFPP